MTRASLGAKQVGEHLILDIEHYRQHPDCDHLVCLVYDPEGGISNPGGLVNDLERIEDEFRVTVFIVPRQD